MQIFATVLYIGIFLYFLGFTGMALLFHLSKSAKINVLDFLSSWFNIKIYYKQRIYNRAPKTKPRPDYLPLPDVQLFEVQRTNVGLIHYKAVTKFASDELRHVNYRPEYIQNIFGKDVKVCPVIENMEDADKFKLHHIIQKIQADVKQMILQNPNLLVKENSERDEYPSYPPIETWTFDLFLPNKPIPQKVEFRALM